MCGIIGAVGTREDIPIPGPMTVSRLIYLALKTVQNRGQDAAGGVTYSKDNTFCPYKRPGLVKEAFQRTDDKEHWDVLLNKLPGDLGIGHVRYPTSGGKPEPEQMQPFHIGEPGLALAHNGQLTNYYREINEGYIQKHKITLTSESDSEALLHVIARELTEQRKNKKTERDYTIDEFCTALKRTYDIVRGSWSVVAIMKLRRDENEAEGKRTLIAFTDPHKIRPLVYGEKDGSHMVASESPTLEILRYNRIRHVPGGSVIFFPETGELVEKVIKEGQPKHCIFEHVYFARPDSTLDGGILVNEARKALGEECAKRITEKGILDEILKKGWKKSDCLVVPVPETAIPAAQVFAEEMGMRYEAAIVKDKFGLKTFIMPSDAARIEERLTKFNIIGELVEGKVLFLIDDSTVRATTITYLTQLSRTCGAKRVELVSHSPPLINPCLLGIDMPGPDLLVRKLTRFKNDSAYRSEFFSDFYEKPERLDELEKMVAVATGADTATYLNLEGLVRGVKSRMESKERDFCTYCFAGESPVPISDQEIEDYAEDRKGREVEESVTI